MDRVLFVFGGFLVGTFGLSAAAIITILLTGSPDSLT